MNYRTDGTVEGTVEIEREQLPPNGWGDFVTLGDERFFLENIAQPLSSRLWKTDGTLEGAAIVAELPLLLELTAVGDQLVAIGNDERRGKELFRLVETTDIPVCEPSLGDIDGDGTVGFSDFLILARDFGSEEATAAIADLDCDGVVGFTDFLILSENFGTSVAIEAVDAVLADV